MVLVTPSVVLGVKTTTSRCCASSGSANSSSPWTWLIGSSGVTSNVTPPIVTSPWPKNQNVQSSVSAPVLYIQVNVSAISSTLSSVADSSASPVASVSANEGLPSDAHWLKTSVWALFRSKLPSFKSTTV